MPQDIEVLIFAYHGTLIAVYLWVTSSIEQLAFSWILIWVGIINVDVNMAKNVKFENFPTTFRLSLYLESGLAKFHESPSILHTL